MKKLRIVLSLIIAGVFLFSGYSKLTSMDAFEVYLYRASFLNFDMAAMTARILVGLEWTIALSLLSRIKFRWGWWLGLLFTLGFSVFLVFQVISGEEANCFCFGELLQMSPMESLFKNLLLVLALFFIRGLDSLKIRRQKLLFVFGFFVFLIIPFAASPPDMWMKGSYNPATHDQEALQTALDSNYIETDFVAGRKLLAFYSTGCRFCRLASERISGMMRKNNLEASSVNIVFWGEDVDPSAFFEETHSLHFKYTSLPTGPYLEITKGRMPLLLLIEDGEVKDQMNYRTLEEERIKDFLGEGKPEEI